MWDGYEWLWKWNGCREIEKWDMKWKYNEWIEGEYDCSKSREEMIDEYNDENKRDDEYLS